MVETSISDFLLKHGVDFMSFVDISGLHMELSQGFPSAVVFGFALSKDFIIAMRDGVKTERDEFVDMEKAADNLADELAEYIQVLGYKAYSQSERSNELNNNYDPKTRTSRLPHKTIARLGGLGYIGKNNLLITEEYGCAIAMCSVLTDAPIKPKPHIINEGQCGACFICRDICPGQAITGNEWSQSGGRESVVDVFKCICALKCMVNCPKTIRYALS